MIRIIIIDSHRLFRVSLKSLIDSFSNFKVVLDVSSLDEIPAETDVSAVDLVIVDPESSKRKIFEKTRKYFSTTRIILLSDKLNKENIKHYLELGISGFFSKDDCPAELERAINSITKNFKFGDVKLGTVIREILMKKGGDSNYKNVIYTERELEILKLVCYEKTNTEISGILNLSVRTIESHRRRMIEKTDCRCIIGVILNAFELNLVNLKKPKKNASKAS